MTSQMEGPAGLNPAAPRISFRLIACAFLVKKLRVCGVAPDSLKIYEIEWFMPRGVS